MSARHFFRIVGILLLGFFTFLMVRLSLPYTAMNSGVDFLTSKQRVYHIFYWRASFYTHVFTSCLVLIAGFTQFNPWLLRRHPRVHRRMGWLYLVTVVFVSGPSAFLMAWHANGGLPARASFTLLSSLWEWFTFYAGWKVIVKRDLPAHGAFMFRSYALTLSAITLRLYTYISAFLPLAASPREIYVTTAWLSWVPNLIIIEMLIRAGWVEKIYKSPVSA